MFKIYEKYEVDRTVFICNYIDYTAKSSKIVDTTNTQLFIDIPREDSGISITVVNLKLILQ